MKEDLARVFGTLHRGEVTPVGLREFANQFSGFDRQYLLSVADEWEKRSGYTQNFYQDEWGNWYPDGEMGQ